jgi:vitamin B12 transporter
MVITYTREEMPESDVAANITVVTRQDIEKMPATTAAEVLQQVPGVYMDYNGGPGSQATAIIQGADTRQVAVYQDGVPLNILANPQTDLSLIPSNTIDRIEVYKGAASSAWGSSLGGVINIITKEPDPTRPFGGEAQSSYGEYNTTRNHAMASGTVDRFGYVLSYNHDQNDGFIPYTAYHQDAAYAKLDYKIGDSSRLNFVSSFDEGRSQAPFAAEPFWDDQFNQRAYQRLLFETTPMKDAILSVEARHQDYKGWIDDVYPTQRVNYFNYTQDSWGASVRLAYATEDWNKLTVGFDGDWGEYDFTPYGMTFPSQNWALYANDAVKLGDFSVTGGVRYDHNYDFGDAVSPSGGVVYHIPGTEALVKVQVAKGFSAPPGAWVNDPVFGNKNLKPETGINYQVGGEVKFYKFLTLTLNLFRADVDDLIRFNQVDNKYENISAATRQGFEAGLKADFKGGLSLGAGGSFIDARDDATGEIIKNVPRILYNASASYSYKWLTTSLLGRYVFNNSSYPETHDRVFVFDYLVKVKLPIRDLPGALSLFGIVHDLGDSGYLYRVDAPQPGRWYEGGVKYEF